MQTVCIIINIIHSSIITLMYCCLYIDVNECEDDPCQGPNTQCNNLVGSYECVCQTGYAFNKDGECIRKYLTPLSSVRIHVHNKHCFISVVTIPVAVCDPPCQNGGACVSPNTCNCIPGYNGKDWSKL